MGCRRKGQDRADVSRMLGLASEARRAKARNQMLALEPDAMEDFENLIIPGRLETK